MRASRMLENWQRASDDFLELSGQLLDVSWLSEVSEVSASRSSIAWSSRRGQPLGEPSEPSKVLQIS